MPQTIFIKDYNTEVTIPDNADMTQVQAALKKQFPAKKTDVQPTTQTKPSNFQRVVKGVQKAMPYAQAVLAGPAALPGEGDYSPIASTVMNLSGAKPAAALSNLPQNVEQMSPSSRFGPVIGAGVTAAEQFLPGVDKKIPDKSLGYLTASMITPGGAGKAITEKAINKAIDTGLAKGIRPSHSSIKDYGGFMKFIKRGRNAIKSIFANKENLNLVDEFGEQTGKMPETLDQLSQAVNQTKQKIFQKYDDMAQAAGRAKTRIDLEPIAREFDTVASNPINQKLHPEVARFAAEKASALRKLKNLSPKEVQDEIAHINAVTKAFQQNPTPQAIKTVTAEALYANQLREALDTSIEKAVGKGYQALKKEYGALKAIEKDVVKRAIVDARKNNKSLIDFSDIASASQLAKGLAMVGSKASAEALISGGTMKWVAAWYKHQNSPNTAIKKMFQAFDQAPGAVATAGKALGMGATQAAAQQTTKAVQPKPGTLAGAEGVISNVLDKVKPSAEAAEVVPQQKNKMSASQKGIDHYTSNRWDEAIREWQKALKEEPKKAKQIISWINDARKEKKNYLEFIKRNKSKVN